MCFLKNVIILRNGRITSYTQVLDALPGQSELCSGHTTFTAIWVLQKSGHLYFLHFAEQSCCEGCYQGSEFVFILDLPPTPTVNQSCKCGAIRNRENILINNGHETEQEQRLDRGKIMTINADTGNKLRSRLI